MLVRHGILAVLVVVVFVIVDTSTSFILSIYHHHHHRHHTHHHPYLYPIPTPTTRSCCDQHPAVTSSKGRPLVVAAAISANTISRDHNHHDDNIIRASSSIGVDGASVLEGEKPEHRCTTADPIRVVLMGRQTEQRREIDRLGEFLKGILLLPNPYPEPGEISSSPPKQENHQNDVMILEANQSKDWHTIAQTLYQQRKWIMIYIHVQQPTQQQDSPSMMISSSFQGNDNHQSIIEQAEDALFVECSDYELCIPTTTTISSSTTTIEFAPNDKFTKVDSDWEHWSWELLRLIARARIPRAIPGRITPSVNTAHLTMGPHTFFLSLTYPNLVTTPDLTLAFEKFCTEVDALEYRTDLLIHREDRFAVLYGMQTIRRLCRPYVVRNPALWALGNILLLDVMPIVYTVRTQHQAGTFPDDPEGIQRMKQLLQWGLRAGVEVLDVESAWVDMVEDILHLAASRSYKSQILGSHHVVGDTSIDLEQAVTLFQQCELNGRAHGAKLVLSIDSEEKDRLAYEAGLIAAELAAQEQRPVIPYIGLILGDIGSFSRIINLPFTPVTHEALPNKAAPGQLTASEIMTARLLTKIFQPLTFCILGHNISYSVSPQMHSAAFAATKLPHKYVRADVATVEEFVNSSLWKSGDFGGTSVTIPHKQAIMKYVDILSESAKRIGSVNTIIAKDEFVDNEKGFQRVIYGDNTDWKGIYNPLHRLLGGTVDQETDYCIIVGAGGTARAAAYVAVQLGLQPLYYNHRTPAKAQELAEHFGGNVIDTLQEGGSLANLLLVNHNKGTNKIRVVISTLPAATEFVLPEWLYTSNGSDTNHKPIIFDVNYKPYYTELLKQAESYGCNVIRGSEMLWEQGVGQFELWTGRTAPYAVMKEVVLQNCLEQ